MDEIRIKGYKSIRDATVSIQPINVLIGGNGAGKTNLIDFFRLLRALANGRLQSFMSIRGGFDRFVHHSGLASEQIEGSVWWDDRQEGLNFVLRRTEEGYVRIKEEVHDDRVREDPSYYEPLSDWKREAAFTYTDGAGADRIGPYLEELFTYSFKETQPNSPFSKLSHVVNDSYVLYTQGDNVAAFLYNIRENHRAAYKRIVRNVKAVAPFFQDFYLQPNEGEFVRLQWRDIYSEFIYGVQDLSDGTLRFIALTTLLLQPELPAVIIIDEPELGLHPVAIAKLAGMIRQASRRGSKVIVATQSTTLISHFDPEDIIAVDNVNGASQFKRLNSKDLEEWLEEYTLGDLWSRNIIDQGQP
jgi:predicted ATPase